MNKSRHSSWPIRFHVRHVEGPVLDTFEIRMEAQFVDAYGKVSNLGEQIYATLYNEQDANEVHRLLTENIENLKLEV